MLISSVLAYSACGLLALRVSLAATFFVHGKMKMGMWKMQPSAQMPAGMLNMMKFLSIAEIAGAIGLFFGILTQLAALGVGIIMIGAIYMKVFKWKVPFANLEKNGWELDLVLLAGALAIFLMGPGMWAVDLLMR